MTRLPYPAAPRVDQVDDLHGHRIADPYRYLEDPGDERTQKWLSAQDDLVEGYMHHLLGRDGLRGRVKELLATGMVTAPTWRGERQFLLRRSAGQEHPVLYTTDPDGTERALIDPMLTDPTGITTLDTCHPDHTGRLLAYQLSEGGTEESILRVMDVATGETVDGPIDRCKFSPVAWLADGRAFYYVRRLPPEEVPEGEEQHHRRIYLHRLGTPSSEDELVFGAGRSKTEFYGVSVSRDGRWLTVSAAPGTAPRNDVWIADLTASPPASPQLRTIQEGADARAHPRVGRDGRLYLRTNRDASRGRLCVTDPDNPAYETWRDLVSEDPEAILEDFAILDGAALERPVLLVEWTRHAVSEVAVHDLYTGERVGEVPLCGLGSIGGIAERPEGGHEAWFSYTDHTTPDAVYRYDARSGEITRWAAAPGTVELPQIDARQVVYTSADGTPVRMFILARPDTAGEDTPRPAILYGYGGFNISLAPTYAGAMLAWVEAGGIYAVANLRGGGEEGEEWHRAGTFERKQNVFDDFHAAAEHLIEGGWTTADQLAINGGSNGGLLVGAALTQRPERYAAVVCAAPLLDMVRYEHLGLGALWNVEYGTADDPEQLGWLLAYSPYHHVREGADYPATLLTVFDGDTRVDAMHARKMCAALQHASTGDGPVLLRRESDVGHGARAVSRAADLAVDKLLFLATNVGLQLGGGA